MDQSSHVPPRTATPDWCLVAVVVSALLGLALLADQAVKLSSTYDEVTYLRIGAHWWRTGEQDTISRLGAPLTVWKVQQAPTLWALDHLGLGAWVTVAWARRLYGPKSMALAGILFAFSPNLLAHGALTTMELPLVATTTAMFLTFWSFLRTGKKRDFWLSAAIGGLAMSCKFTTVLVPPILGLTWAIDLALRKGEEPTPGPLRRSFLAVSKVALGMVPFLAVMAASNLVVTGFATLPFLEPGSDHPVLEAKIPPRFRQVAETLFARSYPSDWVAFLTQVNFQKVGGSSYLLGERRKTGWWYYYPVTLAVKVPLAFWFLFVVRLALKRGLSRDSREWVLPVIAISFLAIAMLGSKRNFGIRYLLPIAPVAIVWVSGLAEGGRRARVCAGLGLAGMGLALAATHPHELSYFNELAGGPIGGRRVLSDSNLDWGQGAKSFARLQRARPEFRDITLFYFGDIDPTLFGTEGRRIRFDANRATEPLPPELAVETKFLAVSASLQWGPWGPPGYFAVLDSIEPIAYTDDKTIAIYRAADLATARKGRGPG
jgi:hypothetical protein